MGYGAEKGRLVPSASVVLPSLETAVWLALLDDGDSVQNQAARRNPSANIERVLSQARVILLDWKRRSRGRAEEGGERNKGRFMCRREIAGLGHGWAQGPARSWFALVMAFVGDVVNRCIKSAERIRERVLFMKWLSQK